MNLKEATGKTRQEKRRLGKDEFVGAAGQGGREMATSIRVFKAQEMNSP